MSCQHKSSVEAGYRYCLRCSAFLPVSSGETLFHYEVLESQSHLAYFYYRVRERDTGRVLTLFEFREYFVQSLRDEMFTRLQQVLRKVFFEPEHYFHYVTERATLGYFVFSEDVWQFLQSARPLNTQKSLTVEQLQALQNYYALCLKTLNSQALSNPGLTLVSTWINQDTDEIRAIDWAFCLPRNTEVVYPHLYLGYHNDLSWLKKRVKGNDYNHTLTQLSVYHSFLEAVLARSSRFFYPEFIKLQYYRSILKRQFIEKMSGFLSSPVLWEDLALDCSQIYVDGLSAAYAQANDSFYAALTLLDNKAYPQALEAIDKAIQIYFNDPVFYWVKAEIAEQSGNIELAMFSLKQGVELHAHFIPFHVRMARLLMGQKKYSDALTLLMHCLKEDQYFPELHTYLGQCYEAMDLPIQAEQCYVIALRQRKIPEAVLGLGQVAKQNRTESDYNLTVNHFKKIASSFTAPAYDSDYYQQMGWGTASYHLEKGQEVGKYTIIECLRKKDFDKKKYKAIYTATREGKKYIIESYDTLYPYLDNLYEQQLAFYQSIHHDILNAPVDAFSEKQTSFLVFPFLEGVTLQDYLEQQAFLSPHQAWQLLISIASLLFQLQKREAPIIHGDIKPANILVTPDFEIYLLDWESMTHLFSEEQAFNKSKTFPYSSPEQEYQLRLSAKSDLFSLGMTLIQAVTGQSPDLFIHYPDQKIDAVWKKYAVHSEPLLFKAIESMVRFDIDERADCALEQLKDWLSTFKQVMAQRQPPVHKKNRDLAYHAAAVLRASENEDIKALRTAARQLLQIQPETRLYYFVANRFFLAGMIDEAIMMANICIRNRQFVQSYWLLAQCLYQKGRLKDAQFLLRQSLESYRKHAFPYLLLARSYYAQQDHKQAIVLYERAMSLMKTLEVLFEYMKCLLEGGAYNTVLEKLAEVLKNKELTPLQRGEALYLQGAAYARQEKYHSAFTSFQEAIQYFSLSRSHLHIYLDLGMSAYHSGERESARRVLEAVLNLEPQHATALYWLAKIALENQDFERVDNLLQQMPEQLSNRQRQLIQELKQRIA